MKKIIIFCDGACSGNGKEENVGGWGAVLKYKDNEKRFCGGALKTTNNIMELTAVIEALKQLNSKQLEVNIYSDSAYVVNCFNNGWYHKWRINGWLTSKKEPVENKALWETLIELVESFEQVNFYKIKGHLDPSKKSDLKKWHTKFNQEHHVNLSEAEFIELVMLNHIADELANEGMTPYK
ncbi:MAG TPA: ribonuclease HI [Clostridiales bacterium UBA8960]|jgi:ribonuclease HI|nr:ribonuclease HI [Clostridiales bacterium UBA8960]